MGYTVPIIIWRYLSYIDWLVVTGTMEFYDGLSS